MKISAVLPAYNEKENLVELVVRLQKILQKEASSFEIICVIQGKDGTLQQMKELKKTVGKPLRLYYFPEPLGIGKAFKTGFCKVSEGYDYVITMDSDLNHQPEELPGFFRAVEETDADIVIGSRYIKNGRILGMPLWKRVISLGANRIVSILFRFPVRDKSSGYRLFRKEVTDYVQNKIHSNNFEIYPEILMIAKNKGYTMTEVPIVFKYRVYGKSKLRIARTGLGYLKLFLRYRKST